MSERLSIAFAVGALICIIFSLGFYLHSRNVRITHAVGLILPPDFEEQMEAERELSKVGWTLERAVVWREDAISKSDADTIHAETESVCAAQVDDILYVGAYRDSKTKKWIRFWIRHADH